MVVAQGDVRRYLELRPEAAIRIGFEWERIQLALQPDLPNLIGG